MTVSAFEPSAFQNNAFQIWADTNIPSRGSLPKKKKKEIASLRKRYEEVATAAADNRKLISVVDAYVATESHSEVERRSKAQYIVDTAPPSPRIDFVRLYQNMLARERLEAALSEIKLQLIILNDRYREEEEFLLLMMLGEA